MAKLRNPDLFAIILPSIFFFSISPDCLNLVEGEVTLSNRPDFPRRDKLSRSLSLFSSFSLSPFHYSLPPPTFDSTRDSSSPRRMSTSRLRAYHAFLIEDEEATLNKSLAEVPARSTEDVLTEAKRQRDGVLRGMKGGETVELSVMGFKRPFSTTPLSDLQSSELSPSPSPDRRTNTALTRGL